MSDPGPPPAARENDNDSHRRCHWLESVLERPGVCQQVARGDAARSPRGATISSRWRDEYIDDEITCLGLPGRVHPGHARGSPAGDLCRSRMPSGTAIETSSLAAPGTPGGRWRRWAMRASSPPTASNIKSTAHGSPLARRRRRTSRENTCIAVMSHDVLVLLCSIVTHGPRVDRFCNRRRC